MADIIKRAIECTREEVQAIEKWLEGSHASNHPADWTRAKWRLYNDKKTGELRAALQS